MRKLHYSIPDQSNEIFGEVDCNSISALNTMILTEVYMF